MPNPAWAKNRIEIYTEPGYIDDNFKEGWSSISAPPPTAESLINSGVLVGDYADHTCDAGNGNSSWYQKDVAAKSLLTNTYPKVRVRLKGSGSAPRFWLRVVYTDATQMDTGWITATGSWEVREVNLTAGKTIRYIIIACWSADSGVAHIFWDYFVVEKATPFIPTDMTFAGEANKCLVKEIEVPLEIGLSVSSCKLILHFDSSISYPDVGAIIMVYMAHPGETETEPAQKLFRGRVKGVRQGKPDLISEVVYECADLMEEFTDENFSKEYDTLTNLADIVKDVAAACMGYSSTKFFDVTVHDVDNTSNTIKKEYNGNNALDILKQLAETAQFAGPVYGGVVYLDAGGGLHFEKIGKWTAPVNILDADIRKVIAVKSDIEGVVNYYKVILEEESFYPGDKNQFDETDEDLDNVPDEWFADCDGTPTSGPTMVLEVGNIKRGSGAARMNITSDPVEPTLYVFIRRKQIPGVNWIYATRLKFWMYRFGLEGLDANGLDIRLIGDYPWTGARYFRKDSQVPPAHTVWKEFNIHRVTGGGWQRVNDPGDAILAIEFRLDAAVDIGAGYVILDKIHFVRDETSVNSYNVASALKYGLKRLEKVDATFSTSAEAEYWADNQVNSLKDPYTHALIAVKGRAQIGFRPPQQLALTISNIFHPISAESFQIIRAVHKSYPGSYECELELHEALKLPLPIPDVLEFLKWVARRHRLRQQEKKVSKWTVS